MRLPNASILAALALLVTQHTFSWTPAGTTSRRHPGREEAVTRSTGLKYGSSPGELRASYTLGLWYLNYRNLLGVTYSEGEAYNLTFLQKSRTRQKMKDSLRDISLLAGVRLGGGTFSTEVSAGAGYFWEVRGLGSPDQHRLSGMALTGRLSCWFRLDPSGLGVAISHLHARETCRTLLVLTWQLNLLSF